ncbi:MAG: phosphotransferase system enzyme I (PtsI), partial [Candidatus Omnitrophota bacterium]
LRIHNQDFLIIDGTKGVVIVNPTEETLVQYHSQQDKIEETKGRFEDIKDLPSQTTDGKRIGLFANVELKEEIPSVLKYGADGIGLYRTEFFYMNRVDLPTEQEQFETYKEVAENIKPSCVTIRTLDLGGDKFLSSLQIPRDMSAHIGWRAIQFCLHQPKIFKTQLSAILRASAYGNIRLMYPMITGVNELHQANAILNEVKDTLRSDDVKFDEKMPIGCMIEVPAAAVTANILAKEADFFSIGTNDLIQYTLAIDRVNEQTAELYEPSHPAILQLIKMTVDAAHKEGIKVSLCGEMASELIFAFILVGLEVDDLSMSPVSILQVKEMIRNVGYKEAKKIAKEVLSLSTAEEVEHVLKTRLNKLAPQIFNMES